MSYDLRLHSSLASDTKLKASELNKLEDKFLIKDIKTDPEGYLLGFSVSYSDEDDFFDFWRQDDNSYFSFITFGSPPEYKVKFRSIVKDIASALNLLISDPQASSKGRLSSDEFNAAEYASIQRLIAEKRLRDQINRNQMLDEVTQTDYFVIYFVTTKSPESGDYLMLMLNTVGYYASKVRIGETLSKVISRDMKSFIPDVNYKVVDIKPNFDTAKDKNGNDLPRSAVYLTVPYFDPNEVRPKGQLSWSNLDETK